MALPDYTTQDAATYKANIDSTASSHDTTINTLDGQYKTTGILDVNGAEILKFVPTASATNEVSVKNNTTGNAPQILPSGSVDTNVNLDLDGKGTGFIRTNSQRVYGMFLLDTPEVLLNVTTDSNTYTTMNNSTLGNAGAVAAILRGHVRIEGNGSGGAVQRAAVWVNKDHTGTADWTATGNDSGSILASTATGNTNPEDSYSTGFGVVNLDANNDFMYARDSDGSPTSVSYQIWLIGYYV